jgi:hypothetical protein
MRLDKRVWVIGYQRLMGYGLKFPAHQLGGSKKPWDFGVYGLPCVWVKVGSTVILGYLCAFATFIPFWRARARPKKFHAGS